MSTEGITRTPARPFRSLRPFRGAFRSFRSLRGAFRTPAGPFRPPRRPGRRASRRPVGPPGGRHGWALCLGLLLSMVALPGANAAEGGRGAEIAGALEDFPVYTDDAFAEVLAEEEQRALAEQIEETGLPILVVLAAPEEDDRERGNSSDLAQIVYDHLEREPGSELIMITADRDGPQGHPQAHEWPGQRHQARDASYAVSFNRDLKEASYPIKLRRVVEIIADGNGSERYAQAVEHLERGRDGAAPEEPDESGGGVPTLAVALAVVPLLAVGSALLVLRRRARPAAYRGPRTVFDTAREVDEETLRRRARREVVEFGERLTALEGERGSDPTRLRRALDAYDAAGSVLDRAHAVPDLAGVLALLAEGAHALDPETAPDGLCFFDPLHGTAERRVRWRPRGRAGGLRVPVCQRCAGALRAHRPPEVLTDRHEGREVPYFEVPPEYSLWSATGYGGLGGASLTERVRRGDFTRVRERRDRP